MSMKISMRQVDDVTILDLEGRITLGEGEVKLRDAVRELLAGGKWKILLNLAGVSYIDSAGNGGLVWVFTTVKNSGGELRLLNPSKKIRDLFQVSKLYTVYEVFDEEEKAIESFGGRVSRCECPICGAVSTSFGAAKTVRGRGHRCGFCGLDFAVSGSESKVNVVYLSIQTYPREGIRVFTDPFLRVSISGRLDLFSLTTLRKIWDKIPGVQKRIVDLSCTTDIDDDGWEGLRLLLESTAERIEAAVSLEGARPEITVGRIVAPPVYENLVAAREALGNEPSNQPWQVRAVQL